MAAAYFVFSPAEWQECLLRIFTVADLLHALLPAFCFSAAFSCVRCRRRSILRVRSCAAALTDSRAMKQIGTVEIPQEAFLHSAGG